MLRRALTILSLIGLLLSVGLWGLSCWGISYKAQTGAFVTVIYGSLIIANHDAPISADAAGWHSLGDFTFFTEMGWPAAFRYPNFPGDWEVWMPLWIPTVVFGFSAAPLCWPVFLRRKRKKLGLCLKCGYDLRASKERCPECGTEFETT
ncbi:MAG: hypothetical protein IID41_05995 [Planctomycetes bacterium]|nr:hypothetical protein [Planctomycetota bacterium]